MPSTPTACCPVVDRAALARRRRYEIIVKTLNEVHSSPRLTYHSKSIQTSPSRLQASANEVAESSSESENESCDGTPPRRVVTVFDSDEEGLDRVLPASYPVDEDSPSFSRAYGSPDMSPPTPAQRQRRYVSPSPHSSSSDCLPMPGAFPPTPCLVQEPTSPSNENTQWANDFDAGPGWSSPVDCIKEERDDHDFLA
jgi:hypothetical protein